MEFQLCGFVSPYPATGVKIPEARRISRKPTEAKNSTHRPRIRIFPGVSATGHWVTAPDPYMDKPEANGSSRKLTGAKIA